MLVLININKIITSRVFYILKLLLNNLLFQIYIVETLLSKKVTNLLGMDGNILLNILQSRIKGLKESLYFKKIHSSRVGACLIEQLFLSVLEPICETNENLHSYGFRKSRNSLLVINNIYRNLQSKIIFKRVSLEPAYFWRVKIEKCFDFIYYKQ